MYWLACWNIAKMYVTLLEIIQLTLNKDVTLAVLVLSRFQQQDKLLSNK